MQTDKILHHLFLYCPASLGVFHRPLVGIPWFRSRSIKDLIATVPNSIGKNSEVEPQENRGTQNLGHWFHKMLISQEV